MASTTTKAPKGDGPAICELGGGGLLLPLGGDGEQEWAKGLRVVLYLLGLLWCFMGVGIVSDVFMGAIEAVTAKKKRVKVKGTNRYITVKVWNDTVANLTLMALGSSAPEILLSVIELLGNEFYAGDLGPSTIVGSAAFNLFCISAVCVSAIPDGIRKIKDTAVFAVTASWSVFAYIWLVIILMLITPDIVDLWEGLITFLFFPVLVTLAYMADKGMFSGKKEREEVVSSRVTAAEMSKEELAEMIMKIRHEYGPNLTDEQAIQVIEKQTAPQKSRAEYRVAATKAMTGGKNVHGKDKAGQCEVEKVEGTGDDEAERLKKKTVTMEFAHAKYAVLESAAHVILSVERKGDLSKVASVMYKSKDGTATAGTDYVAVEGKLEFKAEETSQEIKIKIIDDTAYELDEDFFVELSTPQVVGEDAEKKATPAVLGPISMATVTIIDDDEPGTLFFQKESEEFIEKGEDTALAVVVERKNGSKGTVECKYYTENGSAIDPHDYEHVEGTLTFESGQMSAAIEINIKARGRYDGTEMFRVYIAEPSGGAKFDHTTDGGNDNCIMTVLIKADEGNKQKVDKLQNILNMNWDKVRVGHANYGQQFQEALWPGGSREDMKECGMSEIIIHYIAMPWKLLFALIPPPDYADGWVCFNIALVFIGGVTAIIGDMAALLGCCMGVPDSITAITFVALGTSLPDTFASKAAAMQDEYADASIGNVTGSNSVNVFLGLGLPWTIGAFYWASVDDAKKLEWQLKYADTEVPGKYPDGGFAVIAGDLGFSVIVFAICAITCIGILLVRRKVCGGELGGPQPLRSGSSALMVCLWFVYVALSSWKTMDTISKQEAAEGRL
jgi:solute carrier family 8 (sodium/calcium exchanger)